MCGHTGLIEVFNGFADIKHNNLIDLVVLWIIPNGLWLVFPTFMLKSSWTDIVRGLGMASGAVASKTQGKLM
ncbi:MAG: hypothetical protein INR71_12510 [Terriglobus roseus]|nr:hypothetical protein [Terriglobus roseus]